MFIQVIIFIFILILLIKSNIENFMGINIENPYITINSYTENLENINKQIINFEDTIVNFHFIEELKNEDFIKYNDYLQKIVNNLKYKKQLLRENIKKKYIFDIEKKKYHPDNLMYLKNNLDIEIGIKIYELLLQFYIKDNYGHFLISSDEEEFASYNLSLNFLKLKKTDNLEIKEDNIINLLNNNYMQSNPWININSSKNNYTLYPNYSFNNLTENSDTYIKKIYESNENKMKYLNTPINEIDLLYQKKIVKKN